MNEMKVFENQQFGTVRTTIIDGEPWFVAADVCKALEVRNNRDAISRLDADEKGVALTDTLGGQQELAIVNEPGLYTLVLGSRKPEAKAFKRWITHDVIPTIRKTGGYVNNADVFIENYLSMADESTKQLFKLTLDTIDQLNHKVREQGEQIERDAPDVDFARRISKAPDCYSVACLAKFLNANGYTTGKIRLFNQLRNDGYLGRKGTDHNQPLQRYCDMGLFIVQMNPVSFGSEEKFVPTTKVTGKGIRYFYRHYCAPGIKVSDNEIDEAFREFCESEVMAG